MYLHGVNRHSMLRKTTFIIIFTFLTGITYSQSVKWHYTLKDVSFGQTAARDIDGDGKLELIFSTYWNDSNVYCLNAENGSLKWKHAQPGPGGGCNDAGPVIFNPYNNGNLKVVIPGSCMDTTFCVDADSGYVQWKTVTGGGDSPPSVVDYNNDGFQDILHGTFFGNVQCLNGRSGSIYWTLPVDINAAIESEPTVIKTATETLFAVATWDFNYDSNRIACYKASDHSLKWKYYTHNLLYHGPAIGDLFRNGQKELVIGDYDGYLYCLNASNGNLIWKDSVSKVAGGYIGAPVTLADLNNDGYLEIIYMDGSNIRVVNRNDSALWSYSPPADFTNFRGAAIADVNNDNIKDVTFVTNYGKVISLDGQTGNVIRSFDLHTYSIDSLGNSSIIFEVDNAPIIADFDQDGILDLFIIGGKGRSDSTTYNDYGYAFCLSWGVGNGPDWTMFRHDEQRTACLCDANGLPTSINDVHQTNKNLVTIFPNPTNGSFSVLFNSFVNEIVNYTLIDLTGKEILPKISKQINKGENEIFFTEEIMQKIKKGVYVLKVTGNSVNLYERIIFN